MQALLAREKGPQQQRGIRSFGRAVVQAAFAAAPRVAQPVNLALHQHRLYEWFDAASLLAQGRSALGYLDDVESCY